MEVSQALTQIGAKMQNIENNFVVLSTNFYWHIDHFLIVFGPLYYN